MRRVILTFHGIGLPPPQTPPAEAPYWIPVGLLRERLALARRWRHRVEVGVTFDDGHLTDWTQAAPLLAEFGVSATFFLLADRIGAPGFLGKEELRGLLAAGHRIGSHGAGHVDWRRLDEAGRLQEFHEARIRLQDVTGTAVTEAAIPFGRYDRAVLSGLRGAGFEWIYSSDGGAWRSGDLPMPRNTMRATQTRAELETLLLGGENPLRGLRRSVMRRLKA